MTDPNVVDLLDELIRSGDRAALSHLRHAADPDHPDYPVALRWLAPYAKTQWQEHHARVTAELFALWHRGNDPTTTSGSFAVSLRRLAAVTGSDAVERRFVRILRSHEEDLPTHLRSLVGQLRSHGIGIDWRRLHRDLSQWGRPGRHVQLSWARDFYTRDETTDNEEVPA
ncbi:MAG TPA: type I-E CRISPR-associated protein Cse2/CasB [Actinobacteria bacterium]|nr:type I-E CRISPR-associated protein Cse2/CasB [Actinomycetota bacterium]